MAFAFVQKNAATDDASGTSLGVSLTGVGAGNLICVMMKYEGASTTVSISDGTTTLTNDTNNSFAGGGAQMIYAYLLVANSGNKTYTCTLGAARDFRRIIVYEYSYSGTAAFDASNRASGSSTALNSGDITTTTTASADQWVWFGAYGEFSGESVGTELLDGAAADQTQVAPAATAEMWSKAFAAVGTGSAQATLTGANDWGGNVIAFRAASGGAAALVYRPQLLLMGIG